MYFKWVQNHSSTKNGRIRELFSGSSHRNKISWEVFRISSDEK